MQQIGVTLACWGLVCGSLAFVLFFTNIFPAESNVVSVAWLAVTGIMLPLWRIIVRLLLGHLRKNGVNSRTALIIGATRSGSELAKNILTNPQYGLNLIGFCDDRNIDRGSYTPNMVNHLTIAHQT
ncbi:MAG: hypothetical protein VXA68_04680 [Gammaproteobacteria bacterium]